MTRAAAIAIDHYSRPREQTARLRVGFIVGPTGVGKTAFALALAGALDAEIVNGDSRQLYRGLNLGTAKPSAAERARIPHHLIDIADPDRPLDAAAFARLARAALEQICAHGRVPLIVGGSGLYLRALRDGLFEGPAADPTLRLELSALAAANGAPDLHRRLAEVDPAAAARISPNDQMRLIRALEVAITTGRALSAHHEAHRRTLAPPFISLTIGLDLPRAELYAAIDARFRAMVAGGLIDEVRGLLAAGYDPRGDALKTIGYAELAAYLRGELTLDAAIARAQQRSRNLAKRQLTWFRADRSIVWLDPRHDRDRATALLREFFARRGDDGGATAN